MKTTLRDLRIPITATLIAGGAIATNDYQLVHHDRDAAIAAGTKDIFMNILTTTGLIGRYITDWGGPELRLTSISVRLGLSVHPGDTLTLKGEVEDFNVATGVATVSVTASTENGQHASGKVIAIFPENLGQRVVPDKEIVK